MTTGSVWSDSPSCLRCMAPAETACGLMGAPVACSESQMFVSIPCAGSSPWGLGSWGNRKLLEKRKRHCRRGLGDRLGLGLPALGASFGGPLVPIPLLYASPSPSCLPPHCPFPHIPGIEIGAHPLWFFTPLNPLEKVFLPFSALQTCHVPEPSPHIA